MWKEFNDFYDRAAAAAKTALDASQATTVDQFKPLGVQLRAVSRQSILRTANTGMGDVVTLAPFAPAIVTRVTTQSPCMMRPELE